MTAGIAANRIDAAQQLILAVEKSAIHEIVRLDARERERELAARRIASRARDSATASSSRPPKSTTRAPPRAARRLAPRAIGGDRPRASRRVPPRESARGTACHMLGEQHARAVLIEPIELLAAQQEDAAQHELADRARMRLGVRERQRAAPRPAEHEPALDREVLAQALHVGDEVPGRVRFERRVRAAAAGSRADRTPRSGSPRDRRSAAR